MIIRIRMTKIQVRQRPPGDWVLHRQNDEADQGDAGDAVGFESVGRRADAVAGIVAGAVGDDARVSRIVFLDLEDDLHQVGADIGDLREDPAGRSAGRWRRGIRRWQNR